MTRIGTRMIASAKEALAYAEGARDGFVTHDRVDVRALRTRLGLLQTEFAARFGLSIATVRDWEQGRSKPDRQARILLRVIEAAPEVVEGVAKDTAP